MKLLPESVLVIDSERAYLVSGSDTIESCVLVIDSGKVTKEPSESRASGDLHGSRERQEERTSAEIL